ncbi:MAG: hypothetical protein J6M60_07080 [Clostridia bacterium]|nr:hypothetical protein [Clostridia bacterium]
MLDTKKMHMMLKENKTSAEIMEKFSISSEEEFEKELRQSYTSPSSYGKITRMLEKNDKMKRKKKSEDPITSGEVENVISQEPVICAGPALEIEPENSETLEKVLSKIDETLSNIAILESKHKLSFSNRAQIRNRLDSRKKQLQNLEETINHIMKEVELLREDYETEESKMKTYNELIASAKEELDKLNSKRETLETLFILIYADSIEINNEAIDQIPDSWEQVYEKLRNDDRLDYLRVIEQKTLAKFLALKLVLPKNRNQEICFDSNEMEAAYDLVKDLYTLP